MVDSDSITLFGQRYAKSGKKWAVPVPIGDTSIHFEVEPSSDNLDVIKTCIKADSESGNLHLIHHLRISDRTASLAYLEGLIPMAAFKSAQEIEDYIQIAWGDYPVRIYPEANVEEGTYTKTGEVV